MRWVPRAFFWRLRFEHPCRCSASAHLLRVCVCLPPRRQVMCFGTSGRSTRTVGSSLLILLKVIVVCAPRGHAPAAVGTELFVTNAKWTRYAPSVSAPLERMPCSLVCLHAPSVLAGCSALMGTAPCPSAAHAGSLECCAPWRRLRWQGASSLRTRRIQRESGGTRVPRRAPMVIWSV